MKVLLIKGRFCHEDVTERFASAEAAKRLYPYCTFVDAPDFVFPGWGFEPDAHGDDRCLRPGVPEGFAYDDSCGCFVPDGGDPHAAV